MGARQKDKLSFEEALQKLEQIVEKLESGDLKLDESLELFEEGVRLSRLCQKKLEEAQGKIEKLVSEKDGEIETEPFASPEKDEEDQNGTGKDSKNSRNLFAQDN